MSVGRSSATSLINFWPQNKSNDQVPIHGIDEDCGGLIDWLTYVQHPSMCVVDFFGGINQSQSIGLNRFSKSNSDRPRVRLIRDSHIIVYS